MEKGDLEEKEFFAPGDMFDHTDHNDEIYVDPAPTVLLKNIPHSDTWTNTDELIPPPDVTVELVPPPPLTGRPTPLPPRTERIRQVPPVSDKEE